MEGSAWLTPGSAELSRAIRATWDLARKTTRPRFPPGLYLHRSLEEAQEMRAEWERRNFERYHRHLGEQGASGGEDG